MQEENSRLCRLCRWLGVFTKRALLQHPERKMARSAWFALLLSVGVIAWETIFGKDILVQPVAVPETLEKQGVTPEVATQKLIDAVGEIRQAASQHRLDSYSGRDGGAKLRLTEQNADLVLPHVGLSVREVAAYARHLFGLPQMKIVGEVTCPAECSPTNLKLSVRLLDNRVPANFSRWAGTTGEGDWDRVLRQGALLLAARLSPGDGLRVAKGTERDKIEELLRWYDRLLREEGAGVELKARVRLDIGESLVDIERYADALHYLDGALAVRPHDAVALYNRAYSRMALADKPGARADALTMRAVTMFYPQAKVRGEIHAKRAYILSRIDAEPAEVLAAAKEALKADPLNVDAALTATQQMIWLERYADALPVVDKAVRLAPHDSLAHFKRCLVLDKMARKADARAACLRAVDLETDAGRREQMAKRMADMEL